VRWVLLLILIATPAAGQWSNCWPAWEYPRAGNTQLDNLSSSVLERCNAYTYPRFKKTPLAPTFWRFDRTVLTNLKGNVAYSLDKNDAGWVNTNGLAHTNALLIDRILRTTNIYELARIPTNYFVYTPWRGLNGLGGYTNDTTVGHPHGGTNEYTVAGGTNYPAGRTNWYTTDYGMDELRRILSNMTVYCYKDVAAVTYRAAMETNISDWTEYGWELAVTNYSWAGAVEEIETAWGERAATDEVIWWAWSIGAPSANVITANTNAGIYSDYVARLEMWGGYTWSFVFPWDPYFTNHGPASIHEEAFTVDAFLQWQGTNWFGYPGAQDELTFWERIESPGKGITSNIFGTTKWNQTINLPDTFTNLWGYTWCTVGTNTPRYDSYLDMWNNDGFVYIVTYDFDYK
jgi:hypothetical protein